MPGPRSPPPRIRPSRNITTCTSGLQYFVQLCGDLLILLHHLQHAEEREGDGNDGEENGESGQQPADRSGVYYSTGTSCNSQYQVNTRGASSHS